MKGQWLPAVSIWVLAAIGAVAVLAVAHGLARPAMLSLVLAGAVVVTFFVQLAAADRRGFVLRLMASTLGALGVLVLASLVGLLVP